MNVAVLIQARLGSTRLPNKVLNMIDVGGYLHPILGFQIKRLQRHLPAGYVLGVVTTGSPADDQIKQLCEEYSIYCFRGSENDLVDRYYNSALEINADVVVRVTSDCPLLDPNLIVLAVEKLVAEQLDFVGTCEPLPTTFPDGMDVSVFSFAALESTYINANKYSDREHMTFYVSDPNNDFKIGKLDCDKDLSSYRICLDYPDDLDLIKEVVKHSDGKSLDLTMEEIIEIIDNFHLKELNSGHKFGEGWKSAFDKDLEFGGGAQNFASKLCHDITDKLWEEQIKYIPGGAQTFSKMPNAHVKGAAPKLLLRGSGSRVWDLDGNEYVDFVLGLGPVILGHSYKKIDDAYYNCARNYFVTPSIGHPLEAVLAKKLSELIPSCEMVRYGKNGSDATAGAVRLARGITRRNLVACCGYHGWQDWFIGQTPRNRGIPECIGDMTISFKYNDIKSLERIFRDNKDDLACVIMEPIGSEEPGETFLHDVRELCDKNGALLIFDEVVTGFRFNLGGAQKLFNVIPDLSCFGKAIANGYPLSVIAGKAKYMKEYEDVFFSFTYGGELPAIAAALKTIEVLERTNALVKIDELGLRLIQGLNTVVKEEGISFFRAYGRGPWPKYEFDAVGYYTTNELLTLFQQELVRQGFLTRTTPFICFTHSNADIDNLVEASRKALRVVKKSIDDKKVLENIDGEIIQTIIRDQNIKH